MANPFDQFDLGPALVGLPQGASADGPGTQYTPAQMAQLNAARAKLLAAEAAGDPRTYGGEAASLAAGDTANPFDQFDTAQQSNGAQALASGVNEGALTYLPGLPVKAALDVTDLARAGYGYVGSKLGFLSPSQLPSPLDRSQFVMSPEWLQAKIRAAGGSPVIDASGNTEPDRVLHAAGIGVGTSLMPEGSAAQATKNVVSNAVAAATGQAAYDAGASPGTATALSFAPWAVGAGLRSGAAATARGIVRGGADGAAKMQANIDTLKAAGVQSPPVGLAAGNRFGSAMDTFLSMLPGASGTMANAAANMRAGLLGTVSNTADGLSGVQTPFDAGTAIQQGINAYKGRLAATTGHLYGRVGQLIPSDFLFGAPQTLNKGAQLSADIPNMPNVSKILKPDIVPKVNAAMTADVAPKPPVTTTVQSPVLDANGQPFTSQVTTPGTPGGAPFSALQDVRTLIGQDLNDALLTSNKNKGALKQYYGALTGDMNRAAATTDLARMAASGTTQVPSAVNALNRANRIYGQGQDRLELLQPFASAQAPESAFYSLESSLAGGKKASVGAQVMKSLTPAEQDAQTSTIISRLGTATPGQQNSRSTAFSPETFLTNWNKMTPDGKDAAFGPESPYNPVRTKLQAVADATSLIREHNKAWANPSGTAAKSALWETIMGTGATAGGMALGGSPMMGLGLLGGAGAALGGGHWFAGKMTAPGIAQWFANPTQIPIGVLPSQVQRLAALPQYQ